MFALPGIACLIVFMLARPQEFVPVLRNVPFLHLFTVFAVVGYLVDVRLRRLQPIAANTLPWVTAFMIWAVITVAVKNTANLVPRAIEMAILFALYGTIAHGIQRFRTFQAIVGVLAATCMFVTLVCFHQGLAPHQCVGGDESEGAIADGRPDGRSCQRVEGACTGPDSEPGVEYRCEHVGLFGTYSVDDRVRYRGELNDPNEVALTISAGGLAMLIAFIRRKQSGAWKFALGVGFGVALATVFMTQSRGGLMAALLVPGVYLVRRYGFAAMIPAALVALPVLMLGGRSGEAADMSTELRYEAWQTGLDMFHHDPLFGVGARAFGEHHFLTAHNSYVLTLAEMGFLGFFLFVSMIYLSMKTLIVGVRALAHVPGATVAQAWGMALLAAMAGIVFQINTLSFAYHSVLWIFFGLVGAWQSAVRHHQPDLKIRLDGRDLLVIVLLCLGYALVILPLFLRAKGYA